MAALRASLATERFGRTAESRWLARVDSTNVILRAAARAGAPEGTIVAAEEQVAGRGRQGRRWQAPYGSSILVSLLLRPPPEVNAGLLPFVAAVAAAAILEEVFDLPVTLKWPNDVQVGGRKLAGILVEGEFTGDRLDGVVAGMGLNCNVDRATLAALDVPATSLLAELGRPVERVPLLAALLARWEQQYAALLAGTSPIPAWRQRVTMLGATIEVREEGLAPWQGVALDVVDGGALLVRDESGTIRTLHAAEVSVRA